MFKRLISLFLLLAAQYLSASESHEPQVNTKLMAFQDQFKPELVKMGERVYMAFGYDYANFAFIEGDDGLIIIDTGWFSGQVQPAIDAFQLISEKPVKAIIYTHVHSDHTGGAQQFLELSEGSVDIFAHADWRDRIRYDSSSLQPMIARRAFSQMGFVLPPGVNGTVGSGIGPIARANGKSSFVAPTVDVEERLEVVIFGVRIHMMQSPADIKSNLVVWLPDDGVLFSGDALGGTLPYIATPRFEPDRDPREFIQTIELMQRFPAEYLVAGHGRPIIGRKDVVDVLKVNRDVIQFLADQVERYVVLGYTADQIIDELKLPPQLAEHPDLQPHYHRLDWIIRGLYTKHAGWAADNQELLRLSHSEEAQRLVALLGGREKLLDHGERALADGDPRWAATLANYVIRSAGDQRSKPAQDLLSKSYKEIASTTTSAAERNYLLTAVQNMHAPIPWARFFYTAERRRAEASSTSDLLASFGPRFSPDNLMDSEFAVQVIVADESAKHILHVRNGVLMYHSESSMPLSGSLSVSREALVNISIRSTTWSDSLIDGRIEIQSGEETVLKLIGALE